MKIIKPEVEFYGTVPNEYAASLRFIEKCGRLCYRSEDKVTAESAGPFVKRLIKAGHLAMVEHSNFVVRTPIMTSPQELQGDLGQYLHVSVDALENTYIGGSLTAWVKRYDGYQDDTIPYDDSAFTPFFKTFGSLFERGNEGAETGWQTCPPEEIPKELERISAKFICDRGVSHELVRHRSCSFAQESTRYVNYGCKDMEFIEPWWWTEEKSNYLKEILLTSFRTSEMYYKDFIDLGCSPQAARAVLPNALKTEIVVTADRAEWAHILKLRTAPGAHPDMIRLIKMLPDFL